MKDKIIEHAKTKYCSSPCVFTEEQIEIIIDNDCECYNCGQSIFDMNDFPEIKNDIVFCENCYNDIFINTCYICEEHYEKEDVEGSDLPFPKSPFFYYNPVSEGENIKPSGVYETIEYPLFSAATGGLGHLFIWWDNARLICTSKEYIEKYSECDFFEGDEEKAEFCCDECWNKAQIIRDGRR
jgi:hypothetical protein